MEMDTETIAILFAALFAASEILAQIPRIKTNGVFQAVLAILKVLASATKGVRKTLPILVLLMALSLGCAPDFLTNTHHALAPTGTAYDVAMQIAAEKHEQGDLTDLQRDQIIVAAKIFQGAYYAIIDAAAAYSQFPTEENYAALEGARREYDDSQVALSALMDGIGVKPEGARDGN